MKDTGMIRSLDSLGRIVVPAEIRMTRNIEIGDPIEFFVLNDNIIVLRKYTSTECTFCRSLDNVSYFKDQFICSSCIDEINLPEHQSQVPASHQNPVEPSNEIHTTQKRSKTEEMKRHLEKAIEAHPQASQKELAEKLGISQARVSQLKRKLQSNKL